MAVDTNKPIHRIKVDDLSQEELAADAQQNNERMERLDASIKKDTEAIQQLRKKLEQLMNDSAKTMLEKARGSAVLKNQMSDIISQRTEKKNALKRWTTRRDLEAARMNDFGQKEYKKRIEAAKPGSATFGAYDAERNPDVKDVIDRDKEGVSHYTTNPLKEWLEGTIKGVKNQIDFGIGHLFKDTKDEYGAKKTGGEVWQEKKDRFKEKISRGLLNVGEFFKNPGPLRKGLLKGLASGGLKGFSGQLLKNAVNLGGPIGKGIAIGTEINKVLNQIGHFREGNALKSLEEYNKTLFTGMNGSTYLGIGKAIESYGGTQDSYKNLIGKIQSNLSGISLGMSPEFLNQLSKFNVEGIDVNNDTTDVVLGKIIARMRELNARGKDGEKELNALREFAGIDAVTANAFLKSDFEKRAADFKEASKNQIKYEDVQAGSRVAYGKLREAEWEKAEDIRLHANDDWKQIIDREASVQMSKIAVEGKNQGHSTAFSWAAGYAGGTGTVLAKTFGLDGKIIADPRALQLYERKPKQTQESKSAEEAQSALDAAKQNNALLPVSKSADGQPPIPVEGGTVIKQGARVTIQNLNLQTQATDFKGATKSAAEAAMNEIVQASGGSDISEN